jgi:hypothetical protein
MSYWYPSPSSRCKHSRLQAIAPAERLLPEFASTAGGKARSRMLEGNTICCAVSSNALRGENSGLAGPSNTIAKARMSSWRSNQPNMRRAIAAVHSGVQPPGVWSDSGRWLADFLA